MTFHASPSLVALSASVTLPTLRHFFSPSNIFSCCVFLDRSSCHKMITWPRMVAWRLHILFMSDHVASAFCIIVSFDFFAVHEIRSILQWNDISVAFSFFCTCFKIVQVTHPYIRIGSI